MSQFLPFVMDIEELNVMEQEREEMMDCSDSSLSDEGHGSISSHDQSFDDLHEMHHAKTKVLWARFNDPAPKVEVADSLPRLILPPILTSSQYTHNVALSYREYHCRLSSRRTKSNFLVGINVAEMGEFSRISAGSHCQIFASVFRNQRVAVKAVLPDMIHNPVAMDEFNFEIEILARMSHVNICEAIGCGAGVGGDGFCVPFFVMEQVKPLSSCFNLKGNCPSQFTFDHILYLAKGLSSALYYLHEELFYDAMVIHRDIKMENIGMDAKGCLKLFDFGLGRCVKKRTTMNQSYKMTGETGTLRYMAPEVALSQPYTEKVDIYSFAIVVWSMAANSLFLPDCKKSIEFRDKVCIDRVRPPLSMEWPTKFSSLLQSCWQHDHQRRPCFRDITVMIDAIRLAYVREHIRIKSPSDDSIASPRGISSLPSINTVGKFGMHKISIKSGLSDLATTSSKSSGKSDITFESPKPLRRISHLGYLEEEFLSPVCAKAI